MAAPRITLTAGYARPALKREAWEMFKVAKNFEGSGVVTSKLEKGALAMDADGYSVDNGIWHEPNTGVVMLQPGPLWSTFMEDAYWKDDWFGPEEGRANRLLISETETNVQVRSELGSEPIIFMTAREDAATAIAGVAGDAAYTGLNIGTDFDMVWAGKTLDPLKANQGFSLLVLPMGTMSDRADLALGIAFGGEYFLALHHGFAWLWRKDSAGDWYRMTRFDHGAGGAEHGDPYQLTVIPWGPDYLTFVFSQATSPGESSGSSTDTSVRTAFLVELKRFGIEPSFDASINHARKTAPGRLQIAVRKTQYQVAFGLAGVRYYATGIRLMPEPMPQPMPHCVGDLTPVPYAHGIFNQMDSSGFANRARFFRNGTHTVGGVGYTNEDGAAATVPISWDPAEDRIVSLRTWLRPSGNGLYTPEIHALGIAFPPFIEDLDDSEEIDLSTQWRRLTWSHSRDMAAQVMEPLISIPVTDTEYPPEVTDQWKRLLSARGTIKLEIDDEVVFEGTIRRRRSVPEGGVEWQDDEGTLFPRRTLLVSEDMLAVDLWADLDETSAAGMKSLSRQPIGDVLREGFRRAGYVGAQVDIDSELDSIQIDGADEGGDDWKLLNDDASVGDLFRALQSNYATQGRPYLLITRQNGVWKCRFAKLYQTVEDLDGVFVLTTEAEPDGFADDDARWAAGYYRALDQFEPNVDQPHYNSIACELATRTGDGADALACWIAPNPKAWDPAHPEHQTRARLYRTTPSETAFTSTQAGLCRFTRLTFDQICRTLITAGLTAEYQPGIYEDQLFAIIGVAPADDVARGIEIGNAISYGAYRIVSVHPDIERDNAGTSGADAFPASDGKRDFTWSALYSLEYVGVTNFENVPMWTAEENLPATE